MERDVHLEHPSNRIFWSIKRTTFFDFPAQLLSFAKNIDGYSNQETAMI